MKKHLPALADRLQAWAASAGSGNHIPEHQFDGDLQPRDLSLDLLRQLSELGPFGKGNPSPVLRLSNISVDRLQTMGQDGRHLRFEVGRHRAIWWRGAQWRSALQGASRVDLLVALEANTYRGRTSLQLKVEDARVETAAGA